MRALARDSALPVRNGRPGGVYRIYGSPRVAGVGLARGPGDNRRPAASQSDGPGSRESRACSRSTTHWSSVAASWRIC